MWKVNAGRRSALASEFLSRDLVAIGWREAGDYSLARSRAEVLDKVKKAYPDHTDQQNHVAAGQIWRFLSEVAIGDPVLTYDPGTRLYHLGAINGAPEYAPNAIEALPVQRAVDWRATVSRDDLSPSAKGKLGAILTLFKIAPETAIELHALAEGRQPPINPEPAVEDTLPLTIVDPLSDLQEQAIERIKDRLLSLDWDDMQELVAALLRALALLWHMGVDRADKRHFTVRTSQRWWACEQVEDGLPDRRHARLRWRSSDSFFSVPLP